MGDYDEAKKFFDHYSQVDEELLRVRQIVIDNKIPRRINLQPNLQLDPVTGEPVYTGYDETFEGVIKSSVERYSDPFQEDVFREWIKDAKLLRRID
jgi:dipeptidyl-peptidase-3